MATPVKSNRSLFAGKLPPPPSGHVWVEWVGEASPLDNPVVQYGLMTGKYTRDQERVIRALAFNRIARVRGHTRTMRKGNGLGQLPGLTQPVWRWGSRVNAPAGHPKSFCQALPFRDADVIKSSKVGHEFVIHHERDGEALNVIHQDNGSPVSLVTVGTYSNAKAFYRASGMG